MRSDCKEMPRRHGRHVLVTGAGLLETLLLENSLRSSVVVKQLGGKREGMGEGLCGGIKGPSFDVDGRARNKPCLEKWWRLDVEFF